MNEKFSPLYCLRFNGFREQQRKTSETLFVPVCFDLSRVAISEKVFFEDEILDVTSACLWKYGLVVDHGLRLLSLSLTHVKSQIRPMRSVMGESERYNRGKGE